MDAGDVGDVGAVAQHYGERRALSAAERRRSLIRSLRELNNWVKSTQILASVRPGDFVLDLACGKGGDLPKWKEARIGAYAAVDVALASVRADLRNRYNLGRHPFPAALFVADCFAADLPAALLPEFGPFDVVSCQFALHYAFASEARAVRALQSVGALLRPGGVFLGTTADADVLVRRLRGCRGLRFGNDVYSVQFGERAACKTFAGEAPFGLAYTFTLAESVDAVEEYLVHRPTLERLARDAGLQLVWWSNFHTFAHDHVDSRHAAARAAWAHRNLGGLVGEEGPEEPQLSGDEWEAAGLYAAFEFVKLPLPTEPPPPKDLSNVSPAFVDAVDVKGITLDGRIVDLPP